jgi:hypothetical protein
VKDENAKTMDNVANALEKDKKNTAAIADSIK